MAVEAARDALPAAAGRSSVRSVIFASTTAPFAVRSSATLLAGALGLSNSVSTLDASGSLHGGTASTAHAFHAASAGRSLVVASDRRLAKPGSDQESSYGHGAAALVIGADPGVAQFLGSRHRAADFGDHYRLTDQAFDYTLEERWIREAGWQTLVPPTVAELLADAGLGPKDIQHLVVPASTNLARKVAGLCGVAPGHCTSTLEENCGHTGAAHPLLMLVGALEQAQPDEHILLIGFGHGVDALLLRTTDKVSASRPARGLRGALADKRPEPSYTRFLSHCGLLQMDFGMRAERDNRTAHTVAWRRQPEILTLTAGRCLHCGTVQYPKARVCVAPDCRRPGTQTPVSLADSVGHIKTFTEDWLGYSPRPPAIYGNVSFEGGGNLFIDFTDFEPGEAAVGLEVGCVFRLKDLDRTRAFRRYFWKAAPLTAPVADGGS